MKETKPHIVLLGAGYAGMMTTKKLLQKLSAQDADITLVNKHNYHYQTTWLHEVAAGTIDVNRSRIMISDVIDSNRVHIIQDTVLKIDKDNKKVELSNSELTYDYLVISLGFEKASFGISGMDEHAFSIQDVNQSRLIRDHIEYQFAKYQNDVENRDESMLTIIVGGAGFTGIEFCGELAERIPELCKKYDIPRNQVRIINVEGMDSILPGFDPELAEYAEQSLRTRGIEFRLGTFIKEVKEGSIIVGEGEEIRAGTFIWTGGVQANRLVGEAGFELTKGKVNVDNTLRPAGYEDIFILGDCSWVLDKETAIPYPPTAQLAIQEADTCAHNIHTLIFGGTLQEFKYDNKGTVASLGGRDAMGTVFDGRKLYGIQAKVMKNVIDDRYLFMLGGPKLVLKKGKFRPF
ncbi:NADH dehydrogenase [Gracilibacillus halotolerans]|uniref:NADH dehydrogenase n=1 Tax=Gracilibacillus halotolerans TaxID=74386 RepID=A0A841RDC3_9BACI|nr:NAD(P)/FAD-dependent oxidoreductase [Gracilibacillus halotolerans]MBB6511970.1 NADH dehydrogenase [Gracilibacillus halotolerans]